jgi:hypothetical protein
MATRTAKKAAPKKSAAKKAAPKKSAAKKAAPKKGVAKKAAPKKSVAKKAASKKSGAVALLSGGNPQVPKGDGDEPVQAYIAAMPGWKRELGEALDAVIEKAVPSLRKAVRWNSPFYGVVDGEGFFLNVHCLTKYVKVTFFSGTSLDPPPPGGTTKSKEARWVDIHEGEWDPAQMTTWVKQAAKLPGWEP